MDFSLLQICIILSVTLIGAALQGSVGFGYGLVVAPVLVLVEPQLVPGPIIFSAMLLTVLMSFRESESIDYFALKWSLLGRVPGNFLGAGLLAILPLDSTALVLGLIILLSVFMSTAGLHLKVTIPSLIGAGMLSGFTGTTSAQAGPPLALLFQKMDGPTLRSTMGSYFFLGAWLSLFSLFLIDRFGGSEIYSGLVLMPGVLVGFAISGKISPYLDRGYTRPLVLILSGCAAVAVIIKSQI